MKGENVRLLKLTEVCKQTGFSKSSVYRLMKNGDFPTPIKVGDRSNRWLDEEIKGYISEKIAQR